MHNFKYFLVYQKCNVKSKYRKIKLFKNNSNIKDKIPENAILIKYNKRLITKMKSSNLF